MKKIKALYLLFIVLFLLTITILFSIYIGLQFGKGVSKMSKELYEVKKEWKENKVNPIDSIENNITKMIDSVNKKRILNKSNTGKR